LSNKPVSTQLTAALPLVVTPGEPAGIGPDLAVQLAQSGFGAALVFVASAELMAARAQTLGLPLTVRLWDGSSVSAAAPGEMWVLDVPLSAPAVAGQLNVANANYVLSCLDKAIDGCLDGIFSGLVTGPVHKGVINEAGVPFSGHTEYLQSRCGVSRVVMMLASPKMKVALATTHLPLKDVSAAITQESLSEVIAILLSDLKQKFGLDRPRILIAGLNPHAGEGGHMGREEIDVIEPVIASFSAQDAELLGPLPADTLFTPKYLENADAVLAMFHDQGLPVLKYDGFGDAVNITLGLPIMRTSVDHGTALDIAGAGKADSGSFRCAISMAITMATAITVSTTNMTAAAQ